MARPARPMRSRKTGSAAKRLICRANTAASPGGWPSAFSSSGYDRRAARPAGDHWFSRSHPFNNHHSKRFRRGTGVDNNVESAHGAPGRIEKTREADFSFQS